MKECQDCVMKPSFWIVSDMHTQVLMLIFHGESIKDSTMGT